MAPLLDLLGAVCDSCDAYVEPGKPSCPACGTSLSGAAASPVRPAPALAQSAPLSPRPPGPTPPAPAPAGFRPVAPLAMPPAAAPRPPSPAAVVPMVFPPAASAPGARPASAPSTAIPAAGAPRGGALAPGMARLALMRGGAAAGASYRLGAASCGAGKSQGLILFPEDPFLAPLHATFFFRDGKLWVRDEKGASGVFVRIQGEEPLSAGQMFSAGDRLLRFAGVLPPPPAVVPPVPYGAPAPALLYAVEELVEGGRPGRVCVRPGPVIAVGNAGCELSFAKDPLLAARHCEVVLGPSGAVLRDLGSPEGTFVRLAPGQERALQPGSAVRLGKQVLKVEPSA